MVPLSLTSNSTHPSNVTSSSLFAYCLSNLIVIKSKPSSKPAVCCLDQLSSYSYISNNGRFNCNYKFDTSTKAIVPKSILITMIPLTTWQNRLQDRCYEAQLGPPVFTMVSDRRGGRTAWSAEVRVYGQTVHARFWYDGANADNAKEDAAELALKMMTASSPTSSHSSRSRGHR